MVAVSMPSERAKGRGRGKKRKASSTPAENDQESSEQLETLTQGQRYVPRFVAKRTRASSGLPRQGGVREAEEGTAEHAIVEKPDTLVVQVSVRQLHPVVIHRGVGGALQAPPPLLHIEPCLQLQG